MKFAPLIAATSAIQLRTVEQLRSGQPQPACSLLFNDQSTLSISYEPIS
jgi:hypothetical protein